MKHYIIVSDSLDANIAVSDSPHGEYVCIATCIDMAKAREILWAMRRLEQGKREEAT